MAGAFVEGIGLILVVLASRANEGQPPVAMLSAGIVLLMVGGLLAVMGIMRHSKAKKRP